MIHILLVLLFLLHPFFVGVTDFNLNPKTNTIEISSKLFTNDLEKAISNENKIIFNITNPQNKTQANHLVTLYLQKHLKVTVNNKFYPLNFVGYQITNDAVWCYLETQKIPKIKTISITNALLLTLYPQQINIINLKIYDKEIHIKLDESQTVYNYEIE
jgi:hypothetical protein